MKTLIYGTSDDLVEVDGEIVEEVMDYSEKPIKISCSDGTNATIQYDGNWGISVKEIGTLFDKIVNGNPAEEPHTDEDCKECSPYSDVLVMKEGIEWVKIGKYKFKKLKK